MHRSPAPSRPSVARWPCQFWADCTINIYECEFPTGAGGARGAARECINGPMAAPGFRGGTTTNKRIMNQLANRVHWKSRRLSEEAGIRRQTTEDRKTGAVRLQASVYCATRGPAAVVGRVMASAIALPSALARQA